MTSALSTLAVGAGGLLSGLFNNYSSASAAKKSFQYTSALQQQAAQLNYDYTRKLNQNAYQDTTYSMREAGINPMLAISNGVNGLSTSAGAGSVSQNPTTLDNSALAAFQAYQDKKRLSNESKLASSQVDLNTYTADNLHEQAVNTNEQTRQLMEYGPKLRQLEIEAQKEGVLNTQATTAKVLNSINNDNKVTAATVYNLMQSGHSALSNQKLNNENTKSIKRSNDWFERHPNWYSFSQGTSAIGNIFSGSVSGSASRLYK